MKNKALVVCSTIPYPPNDGARIRTLQLTKYLANSYHVDFVALGRTDEEYADFKSATGVRSVEIASGVLWNRLSSGSKLWFSLLAIVRRSTPTEIWLEQSGLGQHVIERVLRNDYSVVILESSYLMFIAKKLQQQRLSVKSLIVIDTHNVEYLLLKRMADTTHNLLLKFQKALIWRNLRRGEMRMRLVSDLIFAVSDADANLLSQGQGDTRIVVVPNGVDVDYFRPGAAKLLNRICFCGMMSYRPNEEGALWFYTNVWPQVHRKWPQVEWYIVGKDPSPQIRQLAEEDGIVVTGTVDDVRPFVQQSKLSIVPLLSGGGTRLKILESLSMEKTVVSTPVGAEGIDATPQLVIAATAKEFVAAIAKALDENKTPVELTARRFVTEKYSWSAIGRVMEMEISQELELRK